MDRREFALGTLGSILAGMTGAVAGSRSIFSNNFFREGDRGPDTDYDVAIVGGGVSGIYVGSRLVTADPATVILPGRKQGDSTKLKIAVIEGTDRIGGRLLSATSPCFPGIKCELGGMRFLSTQERVNRLVKSLGLQTHSMTTNGNFAFLRGQHIPWEQLNDPQKLPYKLEAAEKKCVKERGAGNLLDWAVRELLPRTKDPDGNPLYGKLLYECLRSAQFQGKPLFQWGFRDFLAQGLSNEAILLSLAVSGFDALGENANAVDLVIESLDFAPGTQYSLVNDGFEAVPWALQDRFEKNHGTVIRKEWLTGFDSVHGNPDRNFALKFRSRRTIYSRSLVLAMPRHSLKSVLSNWPIPDFDGSTSLLDSVEQIPLFKMFLLYPAPWWQTAWPLDKVCTGKSYTDAPIRQCWYWNSIACGPQDEKALVMVYCDMSSVGFWERFRNPGSPIFDQCKEFSEARLNQNWNSNRVPQAMLLEMHRQLADLHGLDATKVPQPLDAAYKDWRDDIYGGAVHFWNPGAKSWELSEKVAHPISNIPLYICGEAYSTNQTWVEGALETADIVLEKHFGLPPFSCLC